MRGRYREHCSSRVRASRDMGAGFPSGVNAPPPTPGGGLAPRSSSQVLCRPMLTSSELRPWRASGNSGKRKTLVKMVSHTLRKRGSGLVWRARMGNGESNCMESSGGHSVPNDEWGGGVYDDTFGQPFTSPTTLTSHSLHPDPEDRAEPHPQSLTLTACFFQSRQSQRNSQIKNNETAMFLSQPRCTWWLAVSPGPCVCPCLPLQRKSVNISNNRGGSTLPAPHCTGTWRRISGTGEPQGWTQLPAWQCMGCSVFV